MTLFDRMKISTRLSLGFGLVLALLVLVAGTSLIRLGDFNRSLEGLATERIPLVIASSQAVQILLQTARSTRNVLILDDEKQVKEELAAVRTNQEMMKEQMIILERRAVHGREKELFQAITEAQRAYQPHEDEFLKIAERGDYSSAKDVLLARVRPAQYRYIQAIEDLSSHEAALSAEDAKRAEDSYQSTRAVVAGLSLLAVLLGVIAAFMIIRVLRRQLNEAVVAARRVADGDLTVKVEAKSKDEIGQLLQALSDMVNGLKRLAGDVAAGAHSVAGTSAEIAQSNHDMAQRTEEQASTLEETASSMEELASTVKQNADSARQVSELARGATEVAQRGGRAVGEVVSTMGEISESSRKIADIIGVIDGIAFQTNILALNAAVEAARAGEQGRGFAVVASEVRNLAQRSAAAAKEIKELIGNSVGRVEAGTKLVDAAGATMQEIVVSVKKVTDLVAEIAAASQQQSAGIEEVSQAVTQMDGVVQQNAALVEEASAAAESMKDQAEGLLRMVSRFKLEAGQGGQAAQHVAQQAAQQVAPQEARLSEVPVAAPAQRPGLAVVHAAPKVKAEPRPRRVRAAPAAALAAAGAQKVHAGDDWTEL